MKTSTLKKLDGILTYAIGAYLGVTFVNLFHNKDHIYLLISMVVFIPFVAGKLIIRRTLKRREQQQISNTASSESNDLNGNQA